VVVVVVVVVCVSGVEDGFGWEKQRGGFGVGWVGDWGGDRRVLEGCVSWRGNAGERGGVLECCRFLESVVV